MEAKRSFLQPMGTLQLMAIVLIVIGHFGIKDNAFMNGLAVSFCFVYSGFFTALHHEFGPSYGLKDHLGFMQNKLAKLYPLYVLAIVMSLVVILATQLPLRPNHMVLLAHLTLLTPWIPDPYFYFGCNPVVWYVCALFFLYLVAPLVVKLLRPIPTIVQVLIIVALLVLEYILGYEAQLGKGDPVLNIYQTNEFPPIRLLDYATGIIIYNLTQTPWWKNLAHSLTPRLSTVVEVAAVAVFALLYWVGATRLHMHCYRAYCTAAPAIVTLLGLFLLTSDCPGALSRALCLKPFKSLCHVTAEVYLLQFPVFFSLLPLFKFFHIQDNPLVSVPITLLVLFVLAFIVHRHFTAPLYQRLKPGTPK